MNEMTPKTAPPENIKRDGEKKKGQHGVAVPHYWPVLRTALSWHVHAGWHGGLVPNCWNFLATLSDHFRDFKVISLALLSAKYCLSFRSFGKVPKNTERCYMSEMYAKGGRFDPFLTRLNMKAQEKRSQIGAKIGSK